MFFQNRREAGAMLAPIVNQHFPGNWDIVGIARGGVIIADEIAKTRGVRPKSICVEEIFRKKDIITASSLGSGLMFKNRYNRFIQDVSEIGLKERVLVKRVKKKQKTFAGPVTDYGPRVLICDDGVVSGMTLLTAVQSFRHNGAIEVAAAVPVALPWLMEQKDFPVATWRVTKMKHPSTGIFYFSFDDADEEEVSAALKK